MSVPLKDLNGGGMIIQKKGIRNGGDGNVVENGIMGRGKEENEMEGNYLSNLQNNNA